METAIPFGNLEKKFNRYSANFSDWSTKVLSQSYYINCRG